MNPELEAALAEIREASAAHEEASSVRSGLATQLKEAQEVEGNTQQRLWDAQRRLTIAATK